MRCPAGGKEDSVGAASDGAQLYVAIFHLLRHEWALQDRPSTEELAAGRMARAVDLGAGTPSHAFPRAWRMESGITPLTGPFVRQGSSKCRGHCRAGGRSRVDTNYLSGYFFWV